MVAMFPRVADITGIR